MKLQLLKYTKTEGWSESFKPAMDSDKTLVLVFGASSFLDEKKVFNELKDTYVDAKIIGCSTAGGILGIEITDEALVVAIVRFEYTILQQTQIAINNGDESYTVGRQITETFCNPDKPNLKGILILSEGLSVNGSELLRGVNENLPASVVVTGGLAGDDNRFENTWVLKHGLPVSGYVTAVAYFGDKINISHGSKGGWESFGPKRLITKAKNNVLYELDGKPALALYKDYLGQRASGLPSTALLFPLAIHSNKNDEDYTVRTILAIDEEAQSMIFAGDIPQNQHAQLMRADFEQIITGASDAASMISMGENVNGDILNIAISCVGRRLVLGERSEEEVEAVLDVLPVGTKQIGFYSYGEISPHVNGHACQLHNQTMTLTTISESK